MGKKTGARRTDVEPGGVGESNKGRKSVSAHTMHRVRQLAGAVIVGLSPHTTTIDADAISIFTLPHRSTFQAIPTVDLLAILWRRHSYNAALVRFGDWRVGVLDIPQSGKHFNCCWSSNKLVYDHITLHCRIHAR